MWFTNSLVAIGVLMFVYNAAAFQIHFIDRPTYSDETRLWIALGAMFIVLGLLMRSDEKRGRNDKPTNEDI